MKSMLFGIALGSLGLLAAASASAMPVGAAPGAGALITQTAGGCGPYAHPNRFGRCEPNMRRRFEEHRFEERRRMEPRCFIRETPYGPRRFCR